MRLFQTCTGPGCQALNSIDRSVAAEADYNEEWYPINDPTWHDKSGQPYGKVPAALDWISYDVRTAATLVACVESDETNHPDHVRSFTGSTMPPGCNRCVSTRRTCTRR